MDLAFVWFLIVGVMFVAYLVLDGFDFGVGMAMPVLARDDTDKRHMINTIAPVWDLNETWLIIGGAAMFAAFPEWYATMFSGFYLPLLVLLLALIVRSVSFEYRHQRPSTKWKRGIDACIVFGSVVPPLIWGVAFTNLAFGVALEQHGPGALMTAGLLEVLQPHALLGGVTFVAVCFAHGLMFLSLKTTGTLRDRAVRASKIATPVALLLMLALAAWVCIAMPHPLTFVCAVAAIVGLVGASIAVRAGRDGLAFGSTVLAIAAATLTLVSTLIVRDGGPFVMPASNPTADFVGLTVQNASSSAGTLEVMTWVAVCSLPLILGYQAWTYWVFRKRITRATIEHAAH